MKYIKISLALVALLSIILTGCSSRRAAEDTEEAVLPSVFFEFVDDSGKEVRLFEKPKRVAVLFSSHAQAVLLAGGSVDITVGESVERGFAKEDCALVDGGAGKQINTELLVSLSPDFVVGSLDIPAHKEACELLSEAGIPTALFRIESFDDYDRTMKRLCGVFDSPEKYRENVALVRERIDGILSSSSITKEKKRILFVRCASTSKATKAKTAKDNFVCQMLKELGTYNIAEACPVLCETLSVEDILLQNPEYIFFSPMGDSEAAKAYINTLLENDEWKCLDAVKNKNYAFLEKDLFQYKPNNRWDTAYKTLLELLYGTE